MTLEEKIYNYIIATWYESKCKDKNEIRKIIHEELKKNKFQNQPISKIGLHVKRRCMNEL